MKNVMEIQKELQNAFYVAFTCGEKDGYIDCCYSDELKKIYTIFDMEQMNMM